MNCPRLPQDHRQREHEAREQGALQVGEEDLAGRDRLEMTLAAAERCDGRREQRGEDLLLPRPRDDRREDPREDRLHESRAQFGEMFGQRKAALVHRGGDQEVVPLGSGSAALRGVGARRLQSGRRDRGRRDVGHRRGGRRRLRILDRLVEGLAHVGRGATELGHRATQRTSQLRQPRRSEDDQRDDQDHEQLGHADAEHAHTLTIPRRACRQARANTGQGRRRVGLLMPRRADAASPTRSGGAELARCFRRRRRSCGDGARFGSGRRAWRGPCGSRRSLPLALQTTRAIESRVGRPSTPRTITRSREPIGSASFVRRQAPCVERSRVKPTFHRSSRRTRGNGANSTNRTVATRRALRADRKPVVLPPPPKSSES